MESSLIHFIYPFLYALIRVALCSGQWLEHEKKPHSNKISEGKMVNLNIKLT